VALCLRCEGSCLHLVGSSIVLYLPYIDDARSNKNEVEMSIVSADMCRLQYHIFHEKGEDRKACRSQQ
jgi:hypothetical protein